MKPVVIFATVCLLLSACQAPQDKATDDITTEIQETTEMKLRASFCDPFKPDVIELGTIEPDKVMETFEKVPWNQYLERMARVDDSEIYFSPSLEIENQNKHGIVASAIAPDVWYIFYKRPKVVKKFFGLTEKLDNDYMTEIHDQSTEDVKACFDALLKNDLNYLDEKIK